MDDRSQFRAEVHQAVGATMVELGVSAKQAFALLRAHAFGTGRPIADVAADIMAKRLRLEHD
jgi:AmiR/NasT family two-component response regulator